MEFLLDDDAFRNGFCWGIHEITVDQGPRIRLPAAVVRTLTEHKVITVWLYPDPESSCLIICPDQSRQQYIKLAKSRLPSSMKSADAYRSFIWAGQPVALRGHGRLSITMVFNRRLTVAKGEQVILLGTGLWYELWRRDDWLAGGKPPRSEP